MVVLVCYTGHPVAVKGCTDLDFADKDFADRDFVDRGFAGCMGFADCMGFAGCTAGCIAGCMAFADCMDFAGCMDCMGSVAVAVAVAGTGYMGSVHIGSAGIVVLVASMASDHNLVLLLQPVYFSL